MASLARLGLFALLFGSTLLLGKVHASLRGGYDLTESSRFPWMVAFTAVVVLTAYALGFPERPSARTPFLTAAIAATLPPALFAVIQIAIGQLVIPRFFLALSIPVNVMLLCLGAWASRRLSNSSNARELVLFLGPATEADVVIYDVDFHTEIPCLISDVIDPSEGFFGERLSHACAERDVSLIVYSLSALAVEGVISMLSNAHASGIRVRDLTDFYDTYIGKVPIRELEATALLFDIREVHHPAYARISRMFDLGFGLLGFAVLGLLIPFVLLGNLFGNQGPLLYSQERVGKGSSVFSIFKFRSMRPGGATSEWTIPGDPRITRFGRFLRTTHIDELPQVLNILRGELSLVGPRPEQPHYVEALSEVIPFYSSRHLVRPGLTGWAQVNYPYGADEIDAFEKLQYEFWYLRHQRLVLDLVIIARTVRHVLGFKGR